MKAAELETLGRRAVACKHWRWMRGMLASNGEEYVRIFYVSANHLHLIELEDDEFGMVRIPKDTCLIPDLSDPATLGCLLALVRIAYGDPSFVVRCVAGLWYEESNKRALVARGSDTEAEALVAALETAP